MKTAQTTEINFDVPAAVAHVPVLQSAEAPPPATMPEAASILNIIDRASRDPSVDVDKLDRLLQMHERVQARNAQVEFDQALSDAQSKMERIRADANNPQTRSKYATYAALDRALRPLYTEAGFSLSFDSGESAPDVLRLLCRVAHKGGHREQHRLDMPADGKGAKGGDVMTKTHATGAAVTYGKRYLLGMIFNIAVGNDDDGNSASNGKPSSRGMAGGGGEFRPERRSPLQEAHDDIVEQTGNTTPQYRVDKLNKAIAAGWATTAKTDKGKIDQIFDFLDMARGPDDINAILTKNLTVIDGHPLADKINEAADRLLRWFESQSAPAL